MELSLRQCEFTHALAELIIYAASLGYQVKIQELNRTLEQQREYVRIGVSKTMDSRHLDRLAADLILFRDGKLVTDTEAYRPLGQKWTALGGIWGGSWTTFKDWDHFQFNK